MSHESNNSNNSILAHTLKHVRDIQAALFELCHADSLVTMHNGAGRQVAVEVLALNHATQHFFWRPRDYAGSDFAGADSQGVLAGSTFYFEARSYGGVQISFQVDRPHVVRADNGTPALCSCFPAQLVRIQRRGAFRVTLNDTYLCASALWRDEVEPFLPMKFRVRDLSINGIGLRIDRPPAALPKPESLMRRVTLDFDKHGTMQVDLAVHNLYPLDRLAQASIDSAALDTIFFT